MTSALTDKDSELRWRLAAVCHKNPYRYKQLAEWLEVYNYIPPNARILHDSFRTYTFFNPSQLFAHWCFIDLIYCTLTNDEQAKLWKLLEPKLIRESSIFHTALYSPYTRVPVNSNSIG